MYFQHSREIWRDFPELVAGVILVEGINGHTSPNDRIATFTGIADDQLSTASVSEIPEIQAWRRAFSRMGLKPTQYRCASESLLRRFRKEKTLPHIHPLIDLCNSISLAFTIPVAALDIELINGFVEVQYASGSETFATFSGQIERPDPHEVIFADGAGQAHARRWTNRQSGVSAVRDTTTDVLIVAEAMHESASEDIHRLLETVAKELNHVWSVNTSAAILSESSPRFEW